ncbi:nitroreductase family protein [Dactylosporangium sucinum]|uniref:Nitroreductase n=1 Tax=Dactylosporangium sucinum TaxID=1424081 RepID=A0A917WV15_9ACTN|nr:nitroreductase family protein [Dactylosporangium sucinum]GGM34945.1 hypothetical protein GCM10007977_040550 [Dactylosporangium sucinum]
MSVAKDYLDAIVRRAREGTDPEGFEIDWGDKPRHAKFYPGADGFALPGPSAEPDPTAGVVTIPVLGDLLFHSYAQLGRRLTIDASGQSLRPRYEVAKWGRGTASGGGIYPVSVYWATGARGAAVPGLYHYFPLQHAMRQLIAGDVTAEIAAALGEPSTADQYLVLGIKFWQSAFKYNTFSYHATGFDVGTILHTWRMLGTAHGVTLTPSLWFDEPRLSRLLNIRPEQEGVFAVVPLDPSRRGPATADGHRPRVRGRDQERSRRVLTFDTVTRLHEATVAGCAERPGPEAVKSAQVAPRPDLEEVPLPAPAPAIRDVRQALRARVTSFGRFEAHWTFTGAQLAAVLSAGAAAAAGFGCDVLPAGEALTLVQQYVFVNHVQGVDPGLYEYDPSGGALRLIRRGLPGLFLQANYTMGNYSLEQAAAVIVPAVRVPALLDALGDRGYRLATAVTGAVTQACYTASAAIGTGCGVALALDAVGYVEELGLQASDEIPLLLMMVGHQRRPAATYRFDLI